ncbi:MAG: pitrilysin family protein [Endomicrobiia bacterium]
MKNYVTGDDIKKEILSNGAVFIHKHNREIPVVSTLIFLKMGSINDIPKLSGVTNLTQTVIIKGTKNRTSQQIALEIESLGGTIGSSVSSDYAEIFCSVGKQSFEKSVEILADIFKNPTFPEEEIRKEKMNIIASIISRKDSIHSVANDYLYPELYKGHPYGRLDIGNVSSVKKISRKDLVNYWEKFYGVDEKNNNLIFVVCGDIEYETAKNMIEKYFADLRKITLPVLNLKKPVVKEKFLSKKHHFKQGYLMYGYLAAELSQKTLKDYLSAKILNSYLGGGMSGKLFQILREENSLCYETNSIYPTKLLSGHFIIYIGVDGDRINLAKEKIDEIIKKLKSKEMITEKDLEETKLKIKGRFLLDHQTSLRQGWYLGFWEIMGLGYDFDNKYVNNLYDITLDDVNSVIDKIFSSQRVVVEIIPKK